MNRSGLSTKPLLFAFVTTLSFSIGSLLGCFVLRYLVKGVFATFGAFAKGLPGFGYIHHDDLSRTVIRFYFYMKENVRGKIGTIGTYKYGVEKSVTGMWR